MFSSLKTLFRLFKGHSLYLSFTFLFAALSISSKMAIPFLTGKVIDILSKGFVFEDLTPYLFTIMGLLIFGAITRYFFDFLSGRLVERVLFDLRNKLHDAILNADISSLDSYKQGDMLSRMLSDIDTVQRGLLSGVMALYEGIVQILITVVFMIILSPILTAAVIVLTPLSMVVSRFIAKKNANSFTEQNASLGELSAFTLECLNNAKTVNDYGLWEDKEKEFEEKAKTLRKSNFKASFAASLINPSTRLVNNTIYAVLILLGVIFLIEKPSFVGAFTVGALASFLSYAYQYMAPFNEIADAGSDMIFASVAVKRIEEGINLKLENKEGKEINEPITSLTVDNVDFGYTKERLVLKDINLHIEKGMKVALVGPTGCGKTTLLPLLMRLYDQQSGSFHFNGGDFSTLSIASIRGKEGVILQEALLLSMSIADNIALGKADASREEIMEAAKKAGADDFIRALPNGYDTMVGRNDGLSEGQKQLINLARVLLLDKDVLLLDEATSHIDLLTEIRLSESFALLCKGKTSLIVAHRLSTIADSDLILVMDKGVIVERGTFDELLKQNGFFAKLYHSQL